jgi:hypothetical protein
MPARRLFDGAQAELGLLSTEAAGTNATASGAFATVTLSSQAGSATGTASASGSGVTSTVSSQNGTGSGSSTTSGALVTVTVSSMAGSAAAAVDGNASGTSNTVTLTTQSGSATGTATATGTSNTVTVSTQAGSGSGSASTSGASSTITASSQSGTSTGSAIGTGSGVTVTDVVQTGSATGTASTSAASNTVTVSSQAGSGTGSSSASGSGNTVTTSSQAGSGTGSSSASASGNTVSVSSQAGTSTGTASVSANSNTITVSSQAGTGSGSAQSSGSVTTVSTTSSSGVATGGATGTGSSQTVSTTAASGSSTGTASASASSNTVTLSSQAGSGSGSALATYTSSVANWYVAVSSFAGSAEGQGGAVQASGNFVTIPFSSQSGSATGTATISASMVTLLTSTQSGVGSGSATASTTLTTLTITSSSGSAAVSVTAGGGFSSNPAPQAPSAGGSGGAGAFASLVSVAVNTASGAGFGSALATPDMTTVGVSAIQAVVHVSVTAVGSMQTISAVEHLGSASGTASVNVIVPSVSINPSSGKVSASVDISTGLSDIDLISLDGYAESIATAIGQFATVVNIEPFTGNIATTTVAQGSLPVIKVTPMQGYVVLRGTPELVNPFERVSIRYSVNCVSRIEWSMSRLFCDPQPHVYTLQGAYCSTANGDFSDIGLPFQHSFFAEDSIKRVFAQSNDFYYRVKLQTPLRTYYSEIVSAYKNLQFRDWRLARELLRKEHLRHDKYTSLKGFLLKRKRHGVLCTYCTDTLTEEVTNSNCSYCKGTGQLDGYFTAVPASMELSLHSQREEIENSHTVGTTKTLVFKDCRMLGDPVPDSYDVFVDSGSDRRFIIHEVTSAAEIRGYPTVTLVTVRQANFSDVVYDIPLGGC